MLADGFSPRQFGAGRVSVVRLLAVLLALSAALGVVGAAPRVARADDTIVQMDANGMPTKAYFPVTGHNVSGDILTAWNKAGLALLGYPLSEPIQENGRTVQYFERARLEYWPEHAGTEWVVQGTLLGRLATQGRQNEAAFRPLPPGTPSDSPDRLIFPETGHSLAYGFKEYWQEHGGVWMFGYPISEEFQEKNADTGKVYTVQYFERARFEYHPEYAGTDSEVLLGRLGAELATERKVPEASVPQASDAVTWNANLFDPAWASALHDISGSLTGFVSTDALSVRSAPDPNAPAIDVFYHRRTVLINGIVRGQPQDGVDAWYVIGDNQYVNAGFIDPAVVATPPQTFAGHWVDVNMSQFWAVAYDGATPLHAVIFTAGRGDSTPLGLFSVLYRVRNETMDSPPGDPDYYHVENVQFTQYFAEGGFALHGNYWTPEDQFGGYSSHGCVGLFNPDAEFFWNWINVGSPIYIHF